MFLNDQHRWRHEAHKGDDQDHEDADDGQGSIVFHIFTSAAFSHWRRLQIPKIAADSAGVWTVDVPPGFQQPFLCSPPSLFVRCSGDARLVWSSLRFYALACESRLVRRMCDARSMDLVHVDTRPLGSSRGQVGVGQASSCPPRVPHEPTTRKGQLADAHWSEIDPLGTRGDRAAGRQGRFEGGESSWFGSGRRRRWTPV